MKENRVYMQRMPGKNVGDFINEHRKKQNVGVRQWFLLYIYIATYNTENKNLYNADNRNLYNTGEYEPI